MKLMKLGGQLDDELVQRIVYTWLHFRPTPTVFIDQTLSCWMIRPLGGAAFFLSFVFFFFFFSFFCQVTLHQKLTLLKFAHT